MVKSHFLLGLFVVTVWFACLSPASAGAAIEWELINPFRLFQQSEITSFHRRVYGLLTKEEQQDPILSVERRLSHHLPHGWAEGLLERTCWSRSRGMHTNCQGRARAYFKPKSHIIKAWMGGHEDAVGDINTKLCRWQLKSLKRKKLLARSQQSPCGDKVEFAIPYPRGGLLEVRLPNGKLLKQAIKVRDIFVVGIGDSFASGEGNPDVPVRFSRERSVVYGNGKNGQHFNLGYPTRAGNWKQVADKEFMKGRAKWMGQSCHRSLYSHQMRAALQLALENPKRAVTFAGYSCAGAEITHGLFLRYKGNEWSQSPPQYSQLSAVARAQCAGRRARQTRYARAYSLDGKLEILNDLRILRCPRRWARKIDLLLVSIGGNDVGFSRLVANVVVNDTLNLKKLGGWMGQVLSAPEATRNISNLKYRYKALRRAIHNVLGVSWSEPDRVIFTAYPNMAFRDKGARVCDDGPLGMTVAPAFSLSSKKARSAERFANKLNKAMRAVSKQYKWSYVEGHREAFTSHGICAINSEQGDTLAENLAFPYFKDGKWQPYNPADYAPYTRRERWFRTPNDAYLTGHLHLSGPVIRNIFKIKSLNRLQVLIAGTYSGAFHPTAEGQAVIADAVARKAAAVLAKYGQ